MRITVTMVLGVALTVQVVQPDHCRPTQLKSPQTGSLRLRMML